MGLKDYMVCEKVNFKNLGGLNAALNSSTHPKVLTMNELFLNNFSHI